MTIFSPYFTYTGQCEVIDDENGDWRIKFLTDDIELLGNNYRE